MLEGGKGLGGRSLVLTHRQRSLIQLIRGLSQGTLHSMRVTCRGVEPWNLALERGARTLAGREGKVAQESLWQAEQDPLRVWDAAVDCAERNVLPSEGDEYRLKFHGLYARRATGDFMLRSRVPGCVLKATQCVGLADIAALWGCGAVDITTRGNVQIRGLAPKNILDVLMAIQETGLSSIGAGADNVRNVMASPTSGLDPSEVCDVRPLAKRLHQYIINHPDLYALPHKFNVAFDSGSNPGLFAEKNDLCFVAVRIGPGFPVRPGVYFRILAGARVSLGVRAADAGILLEPDACVPAAGAIIRHYGLRGDRSVRKQARLRNLIERSGGLERFTEEVLRQAGVPMHPLSESHRSRLFKIGVARPELGVFPQAEPGKVYCGVGVPGGRLHERQLKGIADIAAIYGDGEIRLTPWQNLILPGVDEDQAGAVRDSLARLGLNCRPGSLAGSFIACTGCRGCPFGATDTKGLAHRVIHELDEKLALDFPVNINANACSNGCAHHTFGEIGLLGVRFSHKGQTRAGYHLFAGGAAPGDPGAKPLRRNIDEHDVVRVLEQILGRFKLHRQPGESFLEYLDRAGPVAIGLPAGKDTDM